MRKYILFFLFLAFLVNRTCAETLSDSITIPEITVTANLFEGKLLKVTGGIAVLSLEQLKSQQLISLSNQLNTIPGVYMHEGTYTTNRIVIRGMGSRTPYSTNRIKAYLNDIPLTDGNGVSTLENIDGTSIGRLEVIKGPSSALFGSGLGGTLNLTTLQPDHTIEMETMLGNYSTRMLKLKSSYQKNDFAMSVSVNQINSNGYRENNKLKKYSALFTGYGLVGKSRISLTALYSNINAQIPSSITEEMFLNSPKSAAPNWFQAKGYEQSERFIVGTTLNSRLFNTVSNKATFFGGFSNSFERRPFNDLSDLSKTVGFRNQLKFQFTKAEAILGTEVFFENYLWQTQKDEILINRINENRKYGNLFGMMNFHPIEQLVVTGGININLLNYAYSNEISETEKYTYPIIVSPRVGLNYEFSKSVTSYASLGHGFSAPSLEETLMPNGNKNPNLKPEQGYQYELGFRVTALQNRFYLDLSNYIIQLNNLLLTKRISEENFFGANAGKTNHKGIEIQAFYEVLNSNSFPGLVSIQTSLALSENTFINFIDDGIDYSGNKLPGIPAQTISNTLNWKPIEKLSFNFHHRFFGKQYLADNNNEIYQSTHVFHFNGTYSLPLFRNINTELVGGVNNLLNTHFASMILVNAPSFGGSAPRAYYPAMPRNFYFSIKLSL